MKLLIHICCAPCSIYPVSRLRADGIDVMGFFYRHNIHPYTECLKREETLRSYSDSIQLRMIWQKGYEVERFIQHTAFRESNRCVFCYYDRLKSTAVIAKKGNFEAFSSTLLYSKFQQHDLIKSIGEAVGKETGILFYYSDFREGWKFGVEESKRLGMYRQPYCGCIYSEKERFYKGDP